MAGTTLLVMTDGRRDLLCDTIERAAAMLKPTWDQLVIHDDSGDRANWQYLTDEFPKAWIIHPPKRLGFGGAIRNAWQWLLANDTSPYVFHLEDDFLINRYVDLDAMQRVLFAHSEIMQLALLRNPVNEAEKHAGGVIQQHPDDYHQTGCDICEAEWIEHRRFFTTNPSLYRRDLMWRGWPAGPESEGRFGLELFGEDPTVRCAFWGAGEEWVTHVGHTRVGHGY